MKASRPVEGALGPGVKGFNTISLSFCGTILHISRHSTYPVSALDESRYSAIPSGVWEHRT